MTKKKVQNERLIDKKELAKIVPYSGSQIARLEESGDFPKRIHLGPGRIGWSLSEIMDWIEMRKNARSA